MNNRATAEEMVAAAAASPGAPAAYPSDANSVGPYNKSMRSTLVDNAQPMSFTGLPHYDSNV